MRRKTLQQYDQECAALLRPAGFERCQPDGAGNSYSWEKTFPDGSATSIAYGENNPIGAPALPYWSMLHCFADARFLLSSNLTLPDALSEASHFALCAGLDNAGFRANAAQRQGVHGALSRAPGRETRYRIP